MMLYHMLPGKHWLDVYAADRSTSAMIKGIENCDVFLVFLSPNYFHSAYCCLEIYSAIKLGKPIICCYNSVANNFNTVRGWIPEELRTGLERSEFKKAAHEAELMKPVRTHAPIFFSAFARVVRDRTLGWQSLD
eukprot:scaffold65453_cov36-Tisochrysis_lutea.AAC.3